MIFLAVIGAGFVIVGLIERALKAREKKTYLRGYSDGNAARDRARDGMGQR